MQQESSPVTGIEMPPTSWQCILNLFMAKFPSKSWIFAVLQSFIPSSYVKETPTAKQENDGRWWQMPRILSPVSTDASGFNAQWWKQKFKLCIWAKRWEQLLMFHVSFTCPAVAVAHLSTSNHQIGNRRIIGTSVRQSSGRLWDVELGYQGKGFKRPNRHLWCLWAVTCCTVINCHPGFKSFGSNKVSIAWVLHREGNGK